ncbi:hypothetical protein MDOR_37220 [Mycolicibacterium doricum]|uniref:DUF202 domain-containing protein n=1 Tax=Mycolicibacterium doricum TaxID=126673 RepID=A0A7I7VZJ1_9MYCO|nr:hypothetical protein [Mycolicibacterium doricum]BBZ09553.1 hypothetical protein MDOR_37220 [Mycolicibacterium doricum]
MGGALVLLRQQGPLGPARTLLTITAALLAVLVLSLGYRRTTQIRDSPIIAGRVVISAARAEVLAIGAATLCFATAVVLVLLLYPV